MLEKKTIVDQIEITRSGVIQIRLQKCIVDSDDPDNLSVCEFHRTALEPGMDAAAQFALVDEHLSRLNAGSVAPEEWDRVAVVVDLIHKPETIKSFQQAKAKTALVVK